jgi:hypothetical protein
MVSILTTPPFPPTDAHLEDLKLLCLYALSTSRAFSASRNLFDSPKRCAPVMVDFWRVRLGVLCKYARQILNIQAHRILNKSHTAH